MVNLAPMAESPVLGLDAQWVRLAFDTAGIEQEGRTDMLDRLMAIHRGRMDALRKRG